MKSNSILQLKHVVSFLATRSLKKGAALNVGAAIPASQEWSWGSLVALIALSRPT
jgi:hypothetical protein